MSERTWIVSYKNKKDEVGTVNIGWPGVPTMEDAAIRIRKNLLGENYLLVDMPRGTNEPTVFLLKSYGFEIVSIEEVKD